MGRSAWQSFSLTCVTRVCGQMRPWDSAWVWVHFVEETSASKISQIPVSWILDKKQTNRNKNKQRSKQNPEKDVKTMWWELSLILVWLVPSDRKDLLREADPGGLYGSSPSLQFSAVPSVVVDQQHLTKNSDHRVYTHTQRIRLSASGTLRSVL